MSVLVLQLSRAPYSDDSEISSEQASQIKSYIPSYKAFYGNDSIQNPMKKTLTFRSLGLTRYNLLSCGRRYGLRNLCHILMLLLGFQLTFGLRT